LKLDAGQIQPFEPTTTEYPGAEDSASDATYGIKLTKGTVSKTYSGESVAKLSE